MRKFIVTILASIYLLASTGVPVNMHYCMGKLVNWTLDNQNTELCTYCGMANKGAAEGCCNDDQKFVKNTDDQRTIVNVQVIELSSATLPSSFIYISKPVVTSLTEENPQANAPPPTLAVPIYVRNGVFLI